MDVCIPNGLILIVHDDKDCRILVRHQIEAAGYQVIESAAGNNAGTILGEQRVRRAAHE